ncbi:hypothetical protein PFISCL1PPCAC_19374, partial [Pristionchus fissidentatus]
FSPLPSLRSVMSRSATRSSVSTASTARSTSSSSNASSIDDISSLCDRIQMSTVVRDLSLNTESSSILYPSTEDRSGTTEDGVFSSRYGMIRRYEESALAPVLIRGHKRQVIFDLKEDVQEIGCEGTNRGHEKKGERGTTNLWRKYGALKKLKQVGGYAPKDYKESKGRNFHFFSDKSRLPAPPNPPELTLNRDKKCPSVVACIKIGDKSAEEEARQIAREVESMVNRMSLDDYIDAKNGKKKNTVAAKFNRSGVSSLFRRFSGNSNSSRSKTSKRDQ